MRKLTVAMMVNLACLGGVMPAVMAAGGLAQQGAAVQQGAIDVDVQNLSIEGGDRAPVKFELVNVEYGGKKYKGVKLILEHREKTYNAIRFPLGQLINANLYNTLKFKVQFPGSNPKPLPIGVRIHSKGGDWDGTSMTKHLRHLQPGVDGAYEFSWDMVNQPDIVRGVDLDALRTVTLHPPFGLVGKGEPAGAKREVVIFDMRVVSGEKVQVGNPALFEKWRAFASQYKPDYSDSSHYLGAPEKGRISTPVTLVKDEKSSARIVLPTEPSGPVKLAASELQEWIEKITGAKLEVGPAVSGQPAIYLGIEYARDRYPQDIQALKDTDGYAVRTNGSNIYIFGATDKGTLNGAFAFLENNTDLIWPRSRAGLNAVYTRKPNLEVVWGDALVKPATRLRGWATNSGQRASHEMWSIRNRNNYPTGGGTDKAGAAIRKSQGGYVEYGGGHNLHAFIDPQRKDFYPEIDGKRPDKLNIWKHQLCFTNPDLPDIYIKNLVKYLREKAPADIDCMNVKIEDNRGVCTCERCMAPIILPDGTEIKNNHGAFHSTRFFQFLNQVVAGVRKEYPNLEIGTYAYFFTSTPPLIDVDKNIRVYFCPYIRKDHRTPLSSPINAHWWRQLENWAKKSPNVTIREYYGILNGFRPLAEVVAFDVDSYVDRGVLEYTAELNADEIFIDGRGDIRGGSTEVDFNNMDFWVINQLYWDPKQDVEKLRKYYIRRTFHEAAPYIEKFYGAIRENWYKGRTPSDFANITSMARNMFVTPGREEEMRQYLESAAKATSNPLVKLQIAALRDSFEKAVSWAKDAQASKQFGPSNPQVALQLGWGPNNRWNEGQVWAQSTWTIDQGQPVPAVMVMIPTMPDDSKKVPSVSNTWLKKFGWGDTIQMKLIPKKPEDKAVLKGAKLIVHDMKNKKIVSPAEAITEGADGSLLFKWVLEKPENAKPATLPSLETTRRIELQMPKLENSSERPFDFFIVNSSVTPAPDVGF